MTEQKEIAKIVMMIAAAYPNFNLSEMTVEVYFQVLKDVPADLLKAATMQAISEPGRKFAPSVGEIRGSVAEIIRRSSGMPSSYEAWQEVLYQARKTGHAGKPDFSHPMVHKVVQIFGWRELCLSENSVADRARFIDAYEQISSKDLIETMTLPDVKNYIDRKANNEIKLLAEQLDINE